MLHPSPLGNPHDAPLPGLLQGQRSLHHATPNKRHDHGRRGHLRSDCRAYLRMLRGQPRLDAQLGAQRHGVGIRARRCRRVCALPGRDPVHRGSATGHLPPAQQHCQRRDGRVHHGRAEVPWRAHRYLSRGERVFFLGIRF
uniref:(northern house mosquito) hypothetical protein n=1 Tax=Culex pipiens TaxID=7175 RepID=A0A8D8CJB3_CULPI